MDEPWFDPRLVCIRFIVYILALREILPWVFRFPTVSIFPPVFHTHLDLNTVVVREITSRSLRTFKQMIFSVIGGAWHRRFSFNFSVVLRRFCNCNILDSKIDCLDIRSIKVDPSTSQNFFIAIGHLSHALTTDLVTWNFLVLHGVHISPVCAKYSVLRKHTTSWSKHNQDWRQQLNFSNESSMWNSDLDLVNPWCLSLFIFFDVLLTVHLSIFILVINQLDAQNFCFYKNFVPQVDYLLG